MLSCQEYKIYTDKSFSPPSERQMQTWNNAKTHPLWHILWLKHITLIAEDAVLYVSYTAILSILPAYPRAECKARYIKDTRYIPRTNWCWTDYWFFFPLGKHNRALLSRMSHKMYYWDTQWDPITTSRTLLALWSLMTSGISLYSSSQSGDQKIP